VDTGLGQGDLSAVLESEGIDSESIDRIILTHGHGDHIGGLVDADNSLKFPNASYFIGLIEWRHWLNHPDQENRNVMHWNRLKEALPYERISFIEKEEAFMPGFMPVFLPGHTPGQMGLLIESADRRLLHIADVAHHPLQCAYPQWSVNFDHDRGKSRETRWQVWMRASNEDLLVMAYHFRHFGLGRVLDSHQTWTWEALVSS
jgi:glyoxylase-like metal-dependent hydrolase (beta-lactamase superfamily II)